MTPSSPPAAPWWQFSLRWVFVATALVAVVCAFFARNWVRQAQVRGLVHELRARGHTAITDAELRARDGRHSPAWIEFCLGYPSISVVRIVPEDREFASFPWESLDALGDLRELWLDHPDLRDEHLAHVAKHPLLTEIVLLKTRHLTARGMDALGSGLRTMKIVGRDLPPDAWGCLEGPGDGLQVDLWIRPEQLAHVGPHLENRFCMELGLHFEDFEEEGWSQGSYPAQGIAFSLPPGTDLGKLRITGAWVSEEDLFRTLEENRNLNYLDANVDRLTSRVLSQIKGLPLVGNFLGAREATVEIAQTDRPLNVRMPRLTQELATAMAHGSGKLLIIVPVEPGALPDDLTGLDVANLLGGARSVQKSEASSTPPPGPPSTP